MKRSFMRHGMLAAALLGAGCSALEAPRMLAPVPAAERPADRPPVRRLQAYRGDSMAIIFEVERRVTDATARDWRHDAPPLRWNDHAIDFLIPRVVSPVCGARVMTLLHLAIYRATLAAREAKGTGVFEEAAIAAAASEILRYGYPQSGAAIEAIVAQEVGAYDSDPDAAAGAALGRLVSARLIASARQDGVHAQVPPLTSVAGKWYAPNPLEPGGGEWRPLVIGSMELYRLPVPPEPGTPAFESQLEAVLQAGSHPTEVQKRSADFWASILPPFDLNRIAALDLAEHHTDSLTASRRLTWFNIAMYDALIACWNNKYETLLLRPVHAEPTFKPYLDTPPHPSYPSGHATQATAAAVYWGTLYPDQQELWEAIAEDSAMSRIYGGIHYPMDAEQGMILGRKVAAAVLAEEQRKNGVY